MDDMGRLRLLILCTSWQLVAIERGFPAMQDFDATTVEGVEALSRDDLKEKIWDFLTLLFKRVILFVSFGPGILGVLWLLGRIFKR